MVNSRYSSLLLLLQLITMAIILCVVTIVEFGIMIWKYKSIFSPPPVLVSSGSTKVVEESPIPLDK
jgi:nitrate reductase NapE component